MAREGRDDRAAVFRYDECLVVVVADGAGGTGYGAQAAERVLEGVRQLGWPSNVTALTDLLLRLDRSGGPGESTAVVVLICPEWIAGASVGDSAAWWFQDGDETNLTSAQYRKPLIGSFTAKPVIFFSKEQRRGTLVVASDGLWNYVPWQSLPETLANPPERAARALLELVRYPSGALPDDVAVVVCKLG